MSAVAQTSDQVRQIALERVPKARAIASDAELLQAVLAKNAQRETDAQIQVRDRQWINNLADPLRRALTESRCAQRLRELAKEDPLIVEAILMDELTLKVSRAKVSGR